MDNHKIARLISNILSPQFVSLPVFIAICLTTAPSLSRGLLWFSTVILGISILPVTFILIAMKKGHIKDFYITDRRQRIIPLFILLGIILITIYVLSLEHASRPLMLTMLSGFITATLATLLTLKWKISWHVGSVTIAIMFLALTYGQIWYLLSPLILLVAWARLTLKKHTPLQMVTGVLLAGGVPWIVFTVANYLH